MNGSDKKTDLFDKDEFKEIVAYMEKTDLEFVEFEREGRKIPFRRSMAAIPASRASQAASARPEGERRDEEEPSGPEAFSIRSPIVGRFHSSMGPDRPPLVVDGGLVTAGQKVAIVEAMKIKKEVFSAVTGRVLEILARDGEAVEYGQELFRVQPEQEPAQEG